MPRSHPRESNLSDMEYGFGLEFLKNSPGNSMFSQNYCFKRSPHCLVNKRSSPSHATSVTILTLKINRKAEFSKVDNAISALFTQRQFAIQYCVVLPQHVFVCECMSGYIQPINLLGKLDGTKKELRITNYLYRLLNISCQLNICKNQVQYYDPLVTITRLAHLHTAIAIAEATVLRWHES